MLVRGDDFSCAKTVSDHVYDNDKIDVRFNTEVLNVKGDGMLESITIKNNETGEVVTETVDGGFGVFVFAGYVPATSWLPEAIELEKGYIVTDVNGKTNIDGIYGAGDVCIKNLRQVVTAVSDGATAATSLEKFVEELHISLDIPALVQVKVEQPSEPHAPTTNRAEDVSDGNFISADIKAQLQPVFDRFENNVLVRAHIASDELAPEMSGFVDECSDLHDKIVCSKVTAEGSESYIELLKADGSSAGIKFRAIPGGHEFNSFIIALYSVAGPGKEIPADSLNRIMSIDKETDIKVVISLSCTMCPEVVVGSAQIAAKNDKVNMTMIDLQHDPELKAKYKIMSVPCMIINDETVSFGKKGMDDIIDLIVK